MPTPPHDAERGAGASKELDAEITNPESQPAIPAGGLAAGAAAGRLSEGPPSGPEAFGEIWKLAWPVMTAQVLVNAVGLIDIAMVGRLGGDAVAAVGYASQFFFLAQSALFAVGLACVALMARAIGGRDLARARGSFAASLEVAVVTSLIIIGGVLVAPRAVLGALGAQPAVVEAAVPYLTLLLGSSLLFAVAITIESAMRADRNSVTPMRVAIVVTVVKIALNALLIFGTFGFPRLELVGAGIATAVAQAVGVGILVGAVLRAAPSSPLRLRRADFARARELRPSVVRIALPGVGERLIMNFGLLAYFRILAEFGTPAIAAYTVGIRILAFSWIPGTGFGTAAATLVGQALGAGDPDAATRAGWRSTRAALVVAATLGAVCAFARIPLARLFTDDPQVVAELAPFLLCLAIAQPFLQGHFTLGGAHRGAGDTVTPLVAAAVGNWVLRVPLAAFFAYGLHTTVIWVWYALLFDHLARMCWLAWSFRRGEWRRKLPEAPASG